MFLWFLRTGDHQGALDHPGCELIVSRNDSGVLSISEQVNIHSISHMEVLGSGHAYVDGHVLERFVSMDTKYR